MGSRQLVHTVTSIMEVTPHQHTQTLKELNDLLQRVVYLSEDQQIQYWSELLTIVQPVCESMEDDWQFYVTSLFTGLTLPEIEAAYRENLQRSYSPE